MKISDFRIGTRLMLGFLMVVSVMGGAAGYQIIKMRYVSELYRQNAARDADAIAVKDISKRLADVYSVVADGVINQNMEETRKLFSSAKLIAQKDIAALKSMADTQEEKVWTDTFADKYMAYMKKFEDDMLPLLAVHVEEQDTEKIREVDAEIDAIRHAAEDLLDNMSKALAKEEEESNALFVSTQQATIRLAVILTIIGVVIALFFAFQITRSVTAPLKDAILANNRLADGDLNIDIRTDRKDEVGDLLIAMQKMIGSLKEIIVHVREGAEKMKQMAEIVNTSAEQIATVSLESTSGAQELSQGASENASSTEQVSSSIEEMTANIRQNAENAAQTEKIALKAAQDAIDGGKSVESVVTAMKTIAGKISIIEEIARQTNLLALNAAIEAARAGEHGKGFAVVASEVRKLAERSQKSAAEINLLSVSSVNIAEKAGEMLRQIVPDIRKTSELVQEISAACDEQNSGAQQIGKAVSQLDQVTQQNAAAAENLSTGAEELSAAAEVMAANSKDMLDQTQRIRNAMDFFELGDSSRFPTSSQVEKKAAKGLSFKERRNKDRIDDKFEAY
jgi:methyl-accepting chemotaxis protein